MCRNVDNDIYLLNLHCKRININDLINESMRIISVRYAYLNF